MHRGDEVAGEGAGVLERVYRDGAGRGEDERQDDPDAKLGDRLDAPFRLGRRSLRAEQIPADQGGALLPRQVHHWPAVHGEGRQDRLRLGAQQAAQQRVAAQVLQRERDPLDHPVLRAGHGPAHAGQVAEEGAQLAQHHRLDEVLLLGEPAVDRDPGQPAAPRDVLHRGPAQPEVLELAECRIEDALGHRVGVLAVIACLRHAQQIDDHPQPSARTRRTVQVVADPPEPGSSESDPTP